MDYKSWLQRLDKALFEKFQHLQDTVLENGSFDNKVDPTAYAMVSLDEYSPVEAEYAPVKAREIVRGNLTYLLDMHKNGKVRTNPWTGEEEPKISSVFVWCVAKVRGGQLPELEEELEFIASRIKNGKPLMNKIRCMQRPCNAVYDVLKAVKRTRRMDMEIAKEAEQYALESLKNKFDPEINWSSPREISYVIFGGDIHVELANKFLDTFVNYLGYSLEDSRIQKALDFVKGNTSGTSYAAVASDIAKPEDFFKIPYVENMLEREINEQPRSIQNKIYNFGKLVRLRNKITETG